jgi:hypothetical protein
MPSYRTGAVKPPLTVSPALAGLRRRWVSSNTPSKPDWTSNANALKWANTCMRERKAV